jgi:LysR family glycine cleavage system transcriptional activator
MVRRQLPPLSAIRAFEAAGRRLSFTAAARELCLSQSAVSHAIKALEDHLGRPLFRREGNRVALTEVGLSYLAEVSTLLDGLDASTRRVAGRPPDAPFVVHCTPGFAARWLTPRLRRAPGHRRIAITLSEGAPSTDFASNGADVVIQWASDEVPGVVTEPLMQSARYAVAAPEVAARITRPEALLGETLLYAEVADAWAEWFVRAGVAVGALPPGPRLPNCELSLAAAERGQGITLAYDAMARGSLETGALARLFDTEIPAMTIYSVAYPRRHAQCPEIRAFRDWVFAEVAAQGTLADAVGREAWAKTERPRRAAGASR